MIFKKLEVDGVEPTVTPGKIDIDEGSFYTYNITTLQAILNAVTTYEVPMIGLVHENVDLDFHLEGLDELPVIEDEVEEPETPEEPENPEDGSDDGSDEDENEPDEGEEEESNEGNELLLEKGFYTIDASYLHAKEDKPSSMDRYMDNTVFLNVQEDKIEATIIVNDDKTVTKLQVDGSDAVEIEVDDEKRYETFEFDTLFALHNAYVEYQMGNHRGQAEFLISLDSKSVKEAQESDKPGFKEEEEEDPEEDPEEVPEEENDENTEGIENEEELSSLVPDKVYTINYDIYDENKNNLSVANQFFTGDAILLEKDGKTYAQMTITDGDMVRALSNVYDDAILVKVNEDGSIVVQLRVENDLSDMLLDMHIVVSENAIPGFPGYDAEHSAYLVFNTNTKEEKDVGNHELSAIAGNGNGPEVTEEESTGEVIDDIENNNGKENDEDPLEKPVFGTNDEDGQEVAASTNGDPKNPQTGDTSAIMFYALLLIGSLIPLAVKFKRRFV